MHIPSIPSMPLGPRRRVARGPSAISVLLAVALLLTSLVGPGARPAEASTCPTAAGAYAGGSGSNVDPFRIATTAELLRLAGTSSDWDSEFVVSADLDLIGCAWTPIGNLTTAFTGTFDGGGHTIRGLTLSTTDSYVGLFGYASSATIEGVRLADVDLDGHDYIGGVAGRQLGGTIRDVEVTGTIDGNYWLGGVTGRSTGIIEDARTDVTVTSAWWLAGGIVGQLSGGSATRTRAVGDVIGQGQIGGLVGLVASGGTVSRSAALGDVTTSGSQRYIGGLVGDLNDGTITDAYATGAVTAGQDVGGLVGAAPVTTITRTYALGAVTGSIDRGGLIGRVVSGVSASLWNPTDSGQTVGVAGTESTAAAMRTLAPYTAASWAIVEGWTATPGTDVWGRCDRVNDGAPFLLWEYTTDPCTAPVAPSSGPTLAVSCAGPAGVAGAAPVVGAEVVCSVTGADADIDILWRAAYNPAFAEGVVRTASDGTGTLAFVVPSAAAGSVVSVELVAWLAPLEIGVAVVAEDAGGAPVPTSVPSGGGPVPLGPLAVAAAALMAMVLFASSVSRAARRRSR